MTTPATGFGNIKLTVAEAAAAGRGNLSAELALIKADLDALRSLLLSHTHHYDGSQAGSAYTSPARTNAATTTSGTAAALTITAK